MCQAMRLNLAVSNNRMLAFSLASSALTEVLERASSKLADRNFPS